MHNVATGRPPLRDPWLQRLRDLLGAMPAVVDVHIREDEKEWRVYIEYDWRCSDLYITRSDILDLLLPLHIAFEHSSKRGRITDSTWFDSSDSENPSYFLAVEGMDPCVLDKSIEWFERKTH